MNMKPDQYNILIYLEVSKQGRISVLVISDTRYQKTQDQGRFCQILTQ